MIPWEEDHWKTIEINKNSIRNLSPCQRCAITTVNCEKGAKDQNRQPLKLLRQIRGGKLKKSNQKGGFFGVNMLNETNLYDIKVGDRI